MHPSREFFACFCCCAKDCKLSASLDGFMQAKKSLLLFYRQLPESLRVFLLENFCEIAMFERMTMNTCQEKR